MTFSFQPYLFTLGGLGCLLIISACAQATPAASNSALSQVTLPNSEVRTLKSTNTGRTYDLYIRLPEEYAPDEARRYPVLYVLDGQWDFKLLDSIYGGLYYDKFIPEIIIVGITYSGDNPNYEALRAMDYTPAAEASLPGSGDAAQFLAFFKEELMPLIETHYRADASQRVLMGSSFGGLFALYALFAEPELFSGYVSASPAVPFGNGAIFKQEAEYAAQHQNLPVKLFLSVGELEELAPPVKAFIEVMNERGYQELKMETRIIEGERHSGNKPEAFNRGLRFVLQGER
ncbi:MAG: alpha/beta hydrolase [Anaerolineae bacterium]|nr:alpha/beta hydrolase [Anaerolineae bacterium]